MKWLPLPLLSWAPLTFAQSISSGPLVSVPVNSPVMLLLLTALIVGGAFVLQRRGKLSLPLASVLVLALALPLWQVPALRAQLLLAFTDPAGETLSIAVDYDGTGQFFHPADFSNQSGVPLTVREVILPTYGQCFPLGPAPLGAPLPGTAPNACSQGGLLQHGASCRVDVHAVCEDLAQANTALLSLAPNTLDFVANSSGMVSVTNDAGSAVAAADVVASIPGGSNISVQSTTCGASLAIGASCTIAFTSAVAEGPTTISVAGGNTLPITLDVTVLPDTAQLSLSPTTLDFEVNGSGMVSVTNDAGSAVAATDVVATIPGGSNISVQSTTCGASLAIGASCTITFTSAVAEGPTAVTVAGSNTPATGVDITVLAAPAISLTAPVQQSRVIPVGGGTLNLLVTNSAASAVNATNLTISNKAACPSVVVDDSDCSSVAPGATCTLALSSNTPYAPCVLTLGGDNTANSPQTLVAFSHLGGLVYAESGGVGKVVIDVAQQFSSVWSSVFTDITTSTSDGSSNTDNIVADGSCFINPGQCAAQQCRNIGADWYLPAQDELQSVHGALCTNSAVPCNFGGFTASAYWTSTASTISNATVVSMPSGVIALATKAGIYPVRCVRTF